MNKLLHLIVFALLAANPLWGQEPGVGSPRAFYSDSVIAACPFGHRTIKHVPILYGLIGMSSERKRQVDKYEVVLGGCVVGEPWAIICTSCGFRYREYDSTWSREFSGSETRELAFSRLESPPNSALFSELASLGSNFTMYSYSQEITQSGLITDEVSFHTEVGFESTASMVESFDKITIIKRLPITKDKIEYDAQFFGGLPLRITVQGSIIMTFVHFKHRRSVQGAR
jgi:hypothetical protein